MELNEQMAASNDPRRDDAAMKRVEFHVRSTFNAVEKVIPVETIIEEAAKLRHRAIGIVGQDGARSFIAAEKKAKQAGLLPIFGIRAAIVNEKGRTFECIVYAKNLEGKKHLFKLVSHLLCAEEGKIPQSSIEGLRKGLIISSGGAGSGLLESVLHQSLEEAESIARFCDVLEINPVPAYKEYLPRAGRAYSDAELETANRKICDIGEKLSIEVIAAGNVNEHNGQRESLDTTDEMLQQFEHLGTAKAYEVVVTNTNKLADRFETYPLIPDRRLFPVIEQGDSTIRSLCYDAAESRYGNPLPRVVVDRLDRELHAIIDNGFVAPYLIAAQVVNKSISDGYLVGARGSVGACLTAYLLGITEINPLMPHYVCPHCQYSEWFTSSEVKNGFDLPPKPCPQCSSPLQSDGHDIPCEMFLGLNLDKSPDIDLNVAAEYQEKAHDYLKELYGEHNVFHAGMRNDERHPGGVIIMPEDVDIEEVTPFQCSSHEEERGGLQTHFDYHDIDPIVFKLDILQHDDPSLMRLLRDLTGVDPAAIPLNDPQVLQLFRSTAPLGVSEELIRTPVGTYGIPEMGSPFVRRMLEETQPSAFHDLLQISGLSHGTGVWEGNARELIRSEACTLQTAIALRDNIMLDLISHGLEKDLAFKISEDVRRGNGIATEQVEMMKAYGLPEWYIDSCQQIKYMFPKAHAVSYVISAVRNAFYKLYYPLEFYAAYFTIHQESIDAALCPQGYEAVLNQLLRMEEQADPHSGHTYDMMSLEVALEMSSRGLYFKLGEGGGFYISDSDRSIAIPVTDAATT